MVKEPQAVKFNFLTQESKGFVKHKQVKISSKKEQHIRDIVTPFSSSNTKR